MMRGAEGKAGEASAATAAATAATPSQSEHPEESGGGDADGLAADTMEAVKQLFEWTQLFERTQERGLIH